MIRLLSVAALAATLSTSGSSAEWLQLNGQYIAGPFDSYLACSYVQKNYPGSICVLRYTP